jgi:hypothetical protein
MVSMEDMVKIECNTRTQYSEIHSGFPWKLCVAQDFIMGHFLSMCIMESVGVTHETYPCALNPSITLHLCTACSIGLSRCATLPYSLSLSQHYYFHCVCFHASQISVTATSFCRIISIFLSFIILLFHLVVMRETDTYSVNVVALLRKWRHRRG